MARSARRARPAAVATVTPSRGSVAAAALSQRQLFAAAAVPVLVALAVYLPALRGGFIWDDPLVLQQLREIHSAADLVVLPPIIPRYYYRPLILLSYLIDRTLGGEQPFWFHVSVVAGHALNTLLVFLLVERLFRAEWLLAAGAALLFAVFPTHVESVAWMAGRSDVIVGTFMLATLLLFMERQRAWAPWLGGFTLLLGALSKESALACVVLVPLLDVMSARRLRWERYVPLAVATAAYFMLRAHALGVVIGGMPTGAPAVELIGDVFHAVGFYVVRAVATTGLCAYIPGVPTAWPYLLVGVVVPLVGTALMLAAWSRGSWQPGFLGVWFFVTLAPSLTVIVRHSASAAVADRYLYVPSVASCALLVWAIIRLAQRRQIAMRWVALAIGMMSVAFGAQTVSYARVWADDLAFWSDVTAKVPDDALPHRELASVLIDRGRLEEAEHELQQALVARSDAEGRVMTYGNLGNLDRRLGRYEQAEQAFEAGMKIGPHPTLYHDLGMTLMVKAQDEQRRGDQAAVMRDIVAARAALEQALKLGSVPGASQTFLQQWEPAKTHALLGQVLFSLGDRAGARAHLETALQLDPTGPVADVTRGYLQKLLP
ncbi:MAG TPA: tetratricopeptide repeat protein [Candidatus Acidoferrales bacterium]|nr:tetratricopeptide repeat protein [Candidatus Acidoferrales bacterium]